MSATGLHHNAAWSHEVTVKGGYRGLQWLQGRGAPLQVCEREVAGGDEHDGGLELRAVQDEVLVVAIRHEHLCGWPAAVPLQEWLDVLRLGNCTSRSASTSKRFCNSQKKRSGPCQVSKHAQVIRASVAHEKHRAYSKQVERGQQLSLIHI